MKAGSALQAASMATRRGQRAMSQPKRRALAICGMRQISAIVTLSPKQKGDPLLFFAYPYVEVDGKVGADVKDKRSFTWEAK